MNVLLWTVAGVLVVYLWLLLRKRSKPAPREIRASLRDLKERAVKGRE
jgi:hypothetical protein